MNIREHLHPLMDRTRVFPFMVEALPPVDVSHSVLLYMEDVTVSFDGFKAINNLNLYIDDGELRCIIGPNGAGKSTMMDIVTGKTQPDSGSVWFGQNINLLKMDEPAIAQAGIGRKFQKPTVFEPLTVWQNLELAMAGSRRVLSMLRARLTGEQKLQIEQVLELTGLTDQRNQTAENLSHGQNKR